MKLDYLMLMAVLVSVALPAQADNVPTQCTEVAKGYDEAVLYSVKRQAQLAKEEGPLLAQMEKLNDLAKKPNVPIGKQLTPEQLDEFQKIRAQLVYIQTEMFVASSRDRDMGILFHLCLASAESESLMESYIGDHGQIDDAYSTWVEAQYDKSENKQYLHLLDNLQGLFPTDFAKLLQQSQQLLKQGAGGSGN